MCNQLQYRLNRLASVGYDPKGLVEQRPPLRNGGVSQLREANMDVSGIGSASGATPVRAASSIASQPVAPSSVTAPQDELEISSAGKMLDRLSETPEVRAERLARIKEAIENGVYDTDEKLEAALSRMFNSLGIDLNDD
jgi:anti-sigma28 factor (negative regulator of flagellin synthesis)